MTEQRDFEAEFNNKFSVAWIMDEEALDMLCLKPDYVTDLLADWKKLKVENETFRTELEKYKACWDEIPYYLDDDGAITEFLGKKHGVIK